jgi:hypothetical protein
MSYIFAVTKKIPKIEDDAAFDMLQELREASNEIEDPELLPFVTMIKETYPCITTKTYDDEDDDYEWIWADGPLEGNISGDVWFFSLVSDGLGEPLKFIIEKANSEGYSVFSYEFEKIWWTE